MIAAIPFFEMRMVADGIRVIAGESQFVVPTFGIPVDPWATLVCLGVLLGLEVSRHRAIRMGLDVRDLVDGVVFTVLMGFFMAHVVNVVGYHPERLWEDGIWSILKVWEGFASTGGWLGAIPAIWIFYRFIRPNEVMRFADLIAYGFPLGWFFGRMGCGVVHDHIGIPTDFPLAMAFPPGHYAEGVRHELGLYEMAYMVPILILFWRLGRKDQPPGTFMGLFFVLYAPARFVMDALRNRDLSVAELRYFGLTPAQYGTFVLLAFGLGLLAYARTRRDFRPWALDGAPDQAARALGPQAASDA